MVIDTDKAERLTLEQVKSLSYGEHVFLPVENTFNKHFGRLVEVKVNGKPQTWKRNPNKVRVPYKYGLYEYGYITELDKVYKPR